MKKRGIALLLSLLMVLTFVPVTVFAEEDNLSVINEVDLGVFNHEVGEEPTVITDVGGKYIVFQQEWIEQETGHSVTSFESGKMYNFSLFLEPVQGCTFADDCDVIIDGIEWDSYSSGLAVNEEEYEGMLVFTGYYTAGAEVIREVNLSFPEKLELGKSPVYIETLPEEANYTILKEKWCLEGGETLPEGAVFEVAVVYDYSLALKAKEGYRFTKNTTFLIDDVEWQYKDSFLEIDYTDGIARECFFGTLQQYEKTSTEAVTEALTEASTEASTEVLTEASTEESSTKNEVKTPFTGDINKAVPWGVLVCFSIIGILAAVLYIKKNKDVA